MAAITFDILKSAGVPDKQAKVEALSEVLEVNLKEFVTKKHLSHELRDLEQRINNRFERIDGELKLKSWMLGVLLAGVISLVLKAFF